MGGIKMNKSEICKGLQEIAILLIDNTPNSIIYSKVSKLHNNLKDCEKVE